jgi:hypothetical protein
MKTASSPKTTANVTITMVDLRTTTYPKRGAVVCALINATIDMRSCGIGEAIRASGPMLKIG